MISLLLFLILSVVLLEKYADKSCCAGVKIDPRNLIITTIVITALYYIIKTFL